MATVRVGENDIYYEVHGAGPGLPAVLIMGLGLDLRGWDRQVPVLAASRRVVVMDNRGAGRSAKPSGRYTTALLADDVAAVLDEAGVPVAHVIGVSLGGAIAQEFALRHAKRVRSLTLIATFADGNQMRPAADAGAGAASAGLPLQAMLAAADAGTLQIDPKQVFQFLVPMVFSAEFRARERPFLKEMMERQLAYGFSPAGLAGQVGAAMGHDTIARLATIGAPTLVVHGTKDQLVPRRLSRPLSDGIPGARRVVIEGGTHGLPHENCDALNELLTGWLAEHDPV